MKCLSPTTISFGVKCSFLCILLSVLFTACGGGEDDSSLTRAERIDAPREEAGNQNPGSQPIDNPPIDNPPIDNPPIDNPTGSPQVTAEIIAVEDSNNDDHLPEWVLDNSLDEASRWSALPIDNNNPWVVFEFSDVVSLNRVDIMFFRGHLRTTSFRLETSLNKESWEVAAEFSSTGTSTDFESFNIDERRARFLRFVGLGNSESLWSSIIELRIPHIGVSSNLSSNTVHSNSEEPEPGPDPSGPVATPDPQTTPDPEATPVPEVTPTPVIVAGDSIITVSSDDELSNAITSGSYNNILVEPGIYELADMAKGLDRRANPLTIQALKPEEKPKFVDATQSLELTRHVTFRNLSFESRNLPTAAYWFYDGGGSAKDRSANNIRILSCDFTSASDSVIDTLEKYRTLDQSKSDFAEGMVSGFRFSNWETYNYTLQDITMDVAYTLGDFRMNGDVLIDNIRVDHWYFDGIRILGSGEEGYIDGDRIISNIDLNGSLAKYEEMDERSAPHPDHTQMFNSGSSANNTNPKVQNVLFYRNRFNPGVHRGNTNQTQSGLSQSYMINVGYIENLWGTNQNPHGISIEAGASGVLIERNTLVDVNWVHLPWIRIFRSDGQLIVDDNYFPGGINTNDRFPNRSGCQLDAEDYANDSSTAYEDFFEGPPIKDLAAQNSPERGTDELSAETERLIEAFTPTFADHGIGALNTSSAWRGGAHRPMRAKAPDVIAGVGGFTLNEIKVPTLQSPDQPSDYNCSELRWSPHGRHEWSTVEDIDSNEYPKWIPVGNVLADIATCATVSSDEGLDRKTINLDGVDAVDVQTRCANSAGKGLWSRTATVRIK